MNSLHSLSISLLLENTVSDLGAAGKRLTREIPSFGTLGYPRVSQLGTESKNDQDCTIQPTKLDSIVINIEDADQS